MKKRKNKVFYLATTTDKYELPIAVADTVHELAEILGVQDDAIYCSLSRHKWEHKHHKYHRIYV